MNSRLIFFIQRSSPGIADLKGQGLKGAESHKEDADSPKISFIPIQVRFVANKGLRYYVMIAERSLIVSVL